MSAQNEIATKEAVVAQAKAGLDAREREHAVAADQIGVCELKIQKAERVFADEESEATAVSLTICQHKLQRAKANLEAAVSALESARGIHASAAAELERTRNAARIVELTAAIAGFEETTRPL